LAMTAILTMLSALGAILFTAMIIVTAIEVVDTYQR
jgi:hypothetical protein